MKTSKPLETELRENSIHVRLAHKTFLEHIRKHHCTKTKKMVRKADKAGINMLSMLGLEDSTAQSGIIVHPELVAYAFHLYGLSRKLFLYIVFYETDRDTCTFTADAGMMQRFHGFCLLFGEEEVTDKSILQALRSLIRKNSMIALNDKEYMLNPLIAGGSSENKRRKLIDIYCRLLEEKGLNVSVDFYPRYQLML
jgi:hypothetical protein